MPTILNKRNRGTSFEKLINKTNYFYSENNIAFIYKKPTPINIVKMDKEIIKEAYFANKSTTDYNGIYQGMYIDFDAKSTSFDTFSLSTNLHPHQYQHLLNVANHGGIAFLFVCFNLVNRYFIITIDQIKQLTKKSIRLTFFEEHCLEIKEKLNPPLDYLKAIDLIIERKQLNEK